MLDLFQRLLTLQTINLYHMGPNGWRFIANYDVMQRKFLLD